MNKLSWFGIIIIASIIIYGGGSYVKAQWFDDGSFLTTSTIKSDKVSRISAAGGDLRMYETSPVTAPYMLCVTIAGDSTSSTDCFEKRNYSNVQKTVRTQ